MNRSRTRVLAALAIVIVLAAALGIRRAGLGSPPSPLRPQLARFDRPAPPARVALPIRVDVPKVPCWSCPASEKWPVAFQSNLDLLAPLGDGPTNAALWLKDFAKPQGARLGEAEAAMKRRIAGPGDLGLVLPPDDPLLKEAEAWADQATMRFYPDVWAAEGASTPIPNLLVALSFAKSWVARAASSPDGPAATRGLPPGDPLGTAPAAGGRDTYSGPRRPCVHPDRRRTALRDCGAPRRPAADARRCDRAGRGGAAAAAHGGARDPRRHPGRGKDAITDRKVDDVIGVAKSSPDRRFRNEAIVMLGYARFMGTTAQRDKVENALAELKASPDAFVAGNARWALDLRREDLARFEDPSA